jgi:hypothetical protein
MTTYNLLILDEMIQHHYKSTAVICPSQEEVETALKALTIELQDLKGLNSELLMTLKVIKDMLKDEHMKNEWYDRSQRIKEIEQLIDSTVNRIQIVQSYIR